MSEDDELNEDAIKEDMKQQIKEKLKKEILKEVYTELKSEKESLTEAVVSRLSCASSPNNAAPAPINWPLIPKP